MPLLNISGSIIADDKWKIYDRNIALDGLQAVIVDFDFLQNNMEKCQYHCGHGGRLGVDIANNVDFTKLKPFMPMLSMVVINFPSFTNGRGFSQATHLTRANYHGSIRAKGWLLPDQRRFLIQCRFDEIDLDDNIYMRHGEDAWQSDDMVTLSYQTNYATDIFGVEEETPQIESIMMKRWQNS